MTEKLVTLIDGRQVSNFSEEFRHECEARHVARLPSRSERAKYIDAVHAKRGPDASLALRQLAEKIFYADLAAKQAAEAAKEQP